MLTRERARSHRLHLPTRLSSASRLKWCTAPGVCLPSTSWAGWPGPWRRPYATPSRTWSGTSAPRCLCSDGVESKTSQLILLLVFPPPPRYFSASAAVYALVGAHVADVFLNWAEVSFLTRLSSRQRLKRHNTAQRTTHAHHFTTHTHTHSNTHTSRSTTDALPLGPSRRTVRPGRT